VGVFFIFPRRLWVMDKRVTHCKKCGEPQPGVTCLPCKKIYNAQYSKKHPEKFREANRKSYLKHKETRLKRIAEYYQENKEAKQKYHKELYRSRPDYENQRSRRYREAHKEEVKARLAKWVRENPEKSSIKGQRRRALELGAKGSFSVSDWSEIVERQGGLCYDCGLKKKLTIGHAVPLSRGGMHDRANIIGQCGTCNRKQHTKIHPDFVESEVA
jgi:5-methylcytosine-specific restriction endonuclease McrA